MAYLSRGSRFLLDKLPDDYVYLKNNSAKMRSFDGIVDPRCWGFSAVLRHQHLIDLMSEKGRRDPADTILEEIVPQPTVYEQKIPEETVSDDESPKKMLSENSESFCTCFECDSKPSTLFIDIHPRADDQVTSIEISLPNDDNAKQLIQENRKLRLKLQQARKQEQDYLNRLEKLRNELAEIANRKKF